MPNHAYENEVTLVGEIRDLASKLGVRLMPVFKATTCWFHSSKNLSGNSYHPVKTNGVWTGKPRWE